MAKGDYLSNHQQKIVKRYYQNLDTIAVQKLSEIVSELFLATDAKKRDRLWSQVATHLPKIDAQETRTSRILEKRDIHDLAKVVNEAAARRVRDR